MSRKIRVLERETRHFGADGSHGCARALAARMGAGRARGRRGAQGSARAHSAAGRAEAARRVGSARAQGAAGLLDGARRLHAGGQRACA